MRIDVSCPVCASQFQTTEKRMAAGRGKYCSKSCGATANMTKHGHTTKTSLSRTYTSWSMMLQRCTNPNATNYKRYGGAGVTVCDEWRSFETFLADMGERPEGKTLDRVESDKGYSKGNCRWSFPIEQSSHLKNNVIIQFQGEAYYLSALSRKLGIEPTTLKFRIEAGWPEERWSKPPIHPRVKRLQGKASAHLRA